MKKFLVLAYGYVTPTDEINRAWAEWFGAAGPHLLDAGGPLGQGGELTSSGVTSLDGDSASPAGYCAISAESLEAAEILLKDMPFVDSARVYEVHVM